MRPTNRLPTYKDDEEEWYAEMIFAAFGFAVLAFIVAIGIVSAIVNWHLLTLWSL